LLLAGIWHLTHKNVNIPVSVVVMADDTDSTQSTTLMLGYLACHVTAMS